MRAEPIRSSAAALARLRLSRGARLLPSSRRAPRLLQGARQEELDLRVDAAHLVVGPDPEGFVDLRVEPQRVVLPLCHRGSPASTPSGRGCPR